MSNKTNRELASPTIGWAQISLDFGRDEAWSDIDDPEMVLASAGLAHCLSKDDDWLSRNEVLRSLIPGSEDSKLAAAATLCEIGVWAPEQRGGKDGWVIGCDSALAAKRKRVTNASNAARARYRSAQSPVPQQVDDPFGDGQETPF